MIFFRLATLLFIFLIFSACKEQSNTNEPILETNSVKSTAKIDYAKGFNIIELNGIKKLQLLNPFSNYEIENTFVLLQKGQSYSPLPKETIVNVPLKTIVPLSTTFYSMIQELEQTESIIAISNASIVFSPSIQNGIAHEKIVQVGEDNQLNVEKMILLNPNVVIVNGYSGGLANSYLKLQEAGIPVIKNYDWKETTPLARAEWIKFFGALYNQTEKADSVFTQIETNYNNYISVLDSVSEIPNVLFSSSYQGTWYIPGGNSYVAQFLKDAKGIYPWSSDSTTGSIPLSMETVANKMLDADIWISSESYSLNNLKQKDIRYSEFRPFKEGNVYEHDRRKTKLGGDDFWETGALRVDLILKDYINILHPGILEDQSLTFFRKLD